MSCGKILLEYISILFPRVYLPTILASLNDSGRQELLLCYLTNGNFPFPLLLLLLLLNELGQTTGLQVSICVLLTCLHFFFFGCALRLVGFLVPRPGIEPGPLAVRVQSPNHWTAREFLHFFFALPYFLAPQDALGSSCTFSALSLESASSPRSSGSF